MYSICNCMTVNKGWHQNNFPKNLYKITILYKNISLTLLSHLRSLLHPLTSKETTKIGEILLQLRKGKFSPQHSVNEFCQMLVEMRCILWRWKKGQWQWQTAEHLFYLLKKMNDASWTSALLLFSGWRVTCISLLISPSTEINCETKWRYTEFPTNAAGFCREAWPLFLNEWKWPIRCGPAWI